MVTRRASQNWHLTRLRGRFHWFQIPLMDTSRTSLRSWVQQLASHSRPALQDCTNRSISTPREALTQTTPTLPTTESLYIRGTSATASLQTLYPRSSSTQQALPETSRYD